MRAIQLKILVGEVSSREYKGKVYADAEIKIGTLPLLFSTLKQPRQLDDKSKYSLTFALTKEQRDEVIKTLAPVAVEVAKEKGLKLDVKSATSILKGKLKEAEEEGIYKLNIDQRMFKNVTDAETGETVKEPTEIVIVGPEEGETLKSLYLLSGSTAQAQFILDVTEYDGIVKVPFRLRGVKIVEAKYWEPKEDDKPKQGRPGVSFDGLDSDY